MTYLPGGVQREASMINCEVRSYDVLDAYATLSKSVFVESKPINVGSFQDTLASQLLNSAGNVEASRQIISVSGSMLNFKNCSGAPSCRVIGREDCLNTQHTCGPCLSNYFGSDGDGNSICVPLFSQPSQSGCKGDADCDNYEYCSPSGICNLLSKNCDLDCSGHGRCVYLDVNSGLPVPICTVDKFYCEAICECHSGWVGSSCSQHEEELSARSNVRTLLISQLQQMMVFDEVTSDSVQSWGKTLSLLTQSNEEISEEAVSLILDISTTILSSSSSSETLLELLQSINTIFHYPTSPNRKLESGILDSITFVEDVGSALLSNMIPGEKEYEIFQPSYRFSAHVKSPDPLSGLIEVSTPLRNAEKQNQIPKTTCFLNASDVDSYGISVLSLKSKLISSNASSNPISLKMNKEISSIICHFPHSSQLSPTVYLNESDSDYLNVSCSESDYNIYEKQCFGGSTGNITLRVSCNGTATFHSKRCPLVQLVSDCVLFGDKSDYDCSSRSQNSSQTTCVCTIAKARRLAGGASNNPTLQLYTLTREVLVEFEETIVTADELTLSSLSRSIIVLLMFGSMWGAGILGLLSCYFRYEFRKQKIQNFKTNKIVSSSRVRASSTDANSILTKYLDEVFPVVFQSQSYVTRMFTELLKHHRYFQLGTFRGEEADLRRVVTCCHLLTIQTMLMFLLGLCYELQFPSDDGTCEKESDEVSCLRQTSILNHQHNLCVWKVANSTAEAGGICVYRSEEVSWQTTILISVLVTLFSSIGSLVIDYVFIDVLSAPTAVSLKVASQRARTETTRSQINRRARQLLEAGSQNTGGAPITMAHKTYLFEDEVRVVSPELIDAHAEAIATAGHMLEDTQDKIKKVTEARNTIRLTKIQKSEDEKSSVPIASQSLTSDELMSAMFMEIKEEREKIKKATERLSFDSLWGIVFEPSNEISIPKVCYEAIRDEIQYVLDETETKIKKLSHALDIHIGMEILHLFIVDLLGRDTPAAKIFLMKSEEDFRHTMVVTPFLKFISWTFVILINLGMIFFTLLRGLQRGYHWQKLFLIACIFQFAVEILFYETTECLLMNFIIPDLVRTEVQSVGFSIRQTVQRICAGEYLSLQSSCTLDAPSYLFVSTNVANHFPQTLASAIVLSYHTALPGEIAHKWKPKIPSVASSLFHWTYDTRRRYRRYTLSSVVSLILQYLGAMSPSVQRLILHVAQPMIFGALFLVGIIMSHHPLSFVALGIVLLGLMVVVIRSIWKDCQEQEEERKKLGDQIEVSPNASFDPTIPPKADQKDCEENFDVNLVADSSKNIVPSVKSDLIVDNQSDKDSVSSLRRRLSSCDEISAAYQSNSSPSHRNRGESADSSSYFPYRERGSSVDSLWSSNDFRMLNNSQSESFFNDMIISEELDEINEVGVCDASGQSSNSLSSNSELSSSDTSSSVSSDATISIVIRHL